MVAVHLSHAVGGSLFLGFISAVAFATILAVVAGLALSGASAVSHDLYACVVRKGQASEREEMRVSRIATLGIGVLAVILGILFESQNIAFLSGLVLAIAASVNFPVLFLSMFWKGLTTRGAVAGSLAGLASAIALLVASPAVWVNVLHHEQALFPYANPALFSMTLAFSSAWLFSVTDRSERATRERGRYLAQFIRSMTGIGAPPPAVTDSSAAPCSCRSRAAPTDTASRRTTMSNLTTLQSLIAGRWIGQHGAQTLRSAIDGSALCRTHEERPDFAEAVEFGRRRGIPALMALDFQQRAARLKALGLYLNERKEQLYALSRHSGATRADSWIDIEGGSGTLRLCRHRHPRAALGQRGARRPGHAAGQAGPVRRHPHPGAARRPRRAHQRLQLPHLGMLEKFAPSFLAGMPCIVKPATATSYLTEAAVRLMHDPACCPKAACNW